MQKGIGEKIVRRAVKKLQKVGATDIRFNTEEALVQFYENADLKKMFGLR